MINNKRLSVFIYYFGCVFSIINPISKPFLERFCPYLQPLFFIKIRRFTVRSFHESTIRHCLGFDGLHFLVYIRVCVFQILLQPTYSLQLITQIEDFLFGLVRYVVHLFTKFLHYLFTVGYNLGTFDVVIGSAKSPAVVSCRL